MNKFRSSRLNHEPPPNVQAGTYLITVCATYRVRNTFCHPEISRTIFNSIRFRNEQQIWYCDLAMLMPDHVHLIVHFSDRSPMADVIGDWKRWLTSALGIQWQKNFFDHRLRNEEEVGQKADYVLLNPARAGLVARTEDWPYLWTAQEMLPDGRQAEC